MVHDLNVVSRGERCRHLLSKGLYINAGLPAGERIVGDGNFWCGRNQRTIGPDNQFCDGEQCLNAARSCYEAP
jgi:hypothetical protein